MTERESAHPGSCEIPAELVTENNGSKTPPKIAAENNCVTKVVQNVGPVKVSIDWFASLSRINLTK